MVNKSPNWDYSLSKWPCHGLQMGVILTTYKSWDDPPSNLPKKKLPKNQSPCKMLLAKGDDRLPFSGEAMALFSGTHQACLRFTEATPPT